MVSNCSGFGGRFEFVAMSTAFHGILCLWAIALHGIYESLFLLILALDSRDKHKLLQLPVFLDAMAS